MSGHRKFITSLLTRVLQGETLDRPAAVELARLAGPDRWDCISAAGTIRDHYRGPSIDICSIVNAKSGACPEDCSYCAQSVHYSTCASVYPLISVQDMAQAAESAKNNRARRFCIVTSGRGIELREDLENIARGIRKVRDAGLSPCATLGTLTRDQLAFLRDAGLDRYHHNIETSSNYFPRVCTTHAFEDRLEVIGHARGLGLSVCSGGILGLGESMEDRIDMALTLRDLNVDSVPINFLMPIKGTPLECADPITPLEALHSIALFRFMLPNKEIRICGGRGIGLRSLHALIFTAGADGFMIGNYLTQSGLDPRQDLQMLGDLGLSIAR